MAWFWLKAVPWSTILANAPAVVDGARKLIERRNQERQQGLDPADPATASAVANRLQAVEKRQQEIMELIESLAKSNHQLVRALESLRVRAAWSLRIALALAVVGVILSIKLLLQ
jgi:hypothetical protein